MEVELNVTLQCGNNIWKKGLILNDESAPLPDGILRELAVKTGTIKVLSSKPVPHIKEDLKDLHEELIEQPKKLTRTDITRMNKDALVAFIGDGTKTMDKTRKELIEMATERINDKN